ncbi:putative calcium-binding protein CML46 [Sesamum angolense]|uniref:Calcium-binding protein CML46 n=1 Tax=Sesamum angolense TaxID=2727404 RepID=A0AAE1XDG0_9LAMI|nr:putative calcium-binding protein CML46 [Sesamum angolense]
MSHYEADFKPSDKQETRVNQSVSRGEVEIVLRSLGMCCNSYETKVPATLDADDLFNLFEVENPNLEEVKETFDVFDSRDGFIDAEELQKVLCALGLKEGSEMENCRRMIGMFDENGDGRIDFDEFVKFMESSEKTVTVFMKNVLFVIFATMNISPHQRPDTFCFSKIDLLSLSYNIKDFHSPCDVAQSAIKLQSGYILL